jgi:hypothetical protein
MPHGHHRVTDCPHVFGLKEFVSLSRGNLSYQLSLNPEQSTLNLDICGVREEETIKRGKTGNLQFLSFQNITAKSILV